MAIANNDGSIILTTKVDSSGIKAFSASLKKLSGVLATAFSIRQIIRFSNEAGKFATQTEASVQRLVDIYGSASEAVGNFIDQNSKAIGLSKSAGAAIASTYGNLLSVWADQATNAELTNSLLNQTAVVASKTGRTTQDVAERIRSGLLGNTEAIEDLGINVNIKTIEITDAFNRIADGRSWEQLNAYEQSQVRTLAILEQSTKKYGNTVAETTATVRNEFNAAYEDFQNSWGNIVNEFLIPSLRVMTQVLDMATIGLNAISGTSGKLLENTDQVASNIQKQTENQKELNKEIKKTVAGFDDIQILSFAESGEKSSELEQITNTPKQETDTSASQKKVSDMIAGIMSVVSVSLAVIGILLIATGHVALGIGFLVAGASMFGVTAATIKSEEVTEKIKKTITETLSAMGAGMILVGILCCMAGAWGIGIGLMLVGATSFASPIALNWDAVKNKIKERAGTLVLSGIIYIAIGILLCLTGMFPIAIPILLLGAGMIVAPVALNWNSISQKVKEIFASFGGIIAAAGAALIVIGLLLCCTGAGLGFGIALIIAGAAAIISSVIFNKDAVVSLLKRVWAAVTSFWKRYIAPVFTAKWWSDLGKKALNGLISIFEKGINFIIDKINVFVRGIDKVVSAVGEIFGGDWGVATIPKVKIPRLAQGAVIPPNKEFLAVLGDQKQGTNIEAPLQTIVDAFNIALAQNGGGRGNTEVVLELDGRELGRAVVEQGNRENRRIGTRLVMA